jgi:hypothetical protein
MKRSYGKGHWVNVPNDLSSIFNLEWRLQPSMIEGTKRSWQESESRIGSKGKIGSEQVGMGWRRGRV